MNKLRFERWLSTLKTPNTKRSYSIHVRSLVAFLESRGRSVRELNSEDLAAFKQHLVEQGYAARTINARLIAVGQWVDWMVKERRLPKGLRDAKPERVDSRGRVAHRTIAWGDAKVVAARANFDGRTEVRDHAVVGLFAESGMTLDQLIDLDVRAFRGDRLEWAGRTVKVSGALAQSLRVLTQGRFAFDPLFPGRGEDDRLAHRTVRRIVSDAGKRVGVVCSPSALRDAYVLRRKENGERAVEIAEDMGMTTFSVFRLVRGRDHGEDRTSYEGS